MKGKRIHPGVEGIKKALRSCAVSAPGLDPSCKDCYLNAFNRDGYLSTGRPCFEHLVLDAIDLIDRLNKFDQSQSKKLLEKLAEKEEECEYVKTELGRYQELGTVEELAALVKAGEEQPTAYPGASTNQRSPSRHR